MTLPSRFKGAPCFSVLVDHGSAVGPGRTHKVQVVDYVVIGLRVLLVRYVATNKPPSLIYSTSYSDLKPLPTMYLGGSTYQ